MPCAALPALDGEAVPLAVVERLGEMLEPGAGRVLGADRLDLVLEEAADRRAIRVRPRVCRLAEEPGARVGEAVGAAGIGRPAQAQLHAGARRPLGQFAVRVGDALLRRGDQLL